jgi:hypothetical protein
MVGQVGAIPIPNLIPNLIRFAGREELITALSTFAPEVVGRPAHKRLAMQEEKVPWRSTPTS